LAKNLEFLTEGLMIMLTGMLISP